MAALTIDDLASWLGSAYDELTAEQRDYIVAEHERLEQLWPDPDDADLRAEALARVVQYLLGHATVDDAGQRLLEARRAERAEFAGACRVAAAAAAAGMSESEAARRAGIDRMTLRKTLGKG